ncbi:MAG: TetR/AcrR family transcriptional regulator [Treponema sp.]
MRKKIATIQNISQDMSSKERILQCAAAEFLKNGWEKSNIREIAKQAGITTGSVYFHFKNKAAVFEALVKDTYFELLEKQQHIYAKHFAIPSDRHEERRAVRLQGRKEILEYAYTHFKAMRLLLCAAKGTDYEDLFEKMMHTIHEADLKTYKEYDMVRNLPYIDIELISIIDKTFWECLFQTIRLNIPYEKAQRYVLILDDFYEAGWKKIFQSPESSYRAP